MPLKILIAGAGIAGLTAAIALGRQGHNVELFEKSSFSSEIGAAFHFGPYGCRILRSLGVDLELMNPCVCKRWRALDGSDLSEIHLKFDLEEKKRSLNVEEDEIMIYRVDAHNVLREHALSMPNVQLHLGSGIQHVDADKGEITLSSGAVHHGDLVVGTDGVHSKTLEAIDMDASKTRPIGINMFRFMIKSDEAQSDPVVKSLLETAGFPNTHNTFVHSKTKHLFVLYFCRGGELINCATFQNVTAEKVQLTDSYNNPGSIEEVLHIMEDWQDDFKALIRLATDVKHWAIVGRDVPETFIKGKLVIAGDAAHPTMPIHAAGANMCVEDVGVLGTLMDASVTKENLADRIQMYNDLRYPRSVTVKFASEMVNLNHDKEARERIEQKLQSKVPGGKIPQDMETYLWSFDALQNARDVLAASA